MGVSHVFSHTGVSCNMILIVRETVNKGTKHEKNDTCASLATAY
jgi:hypothetical protein